MRSIWATLAICLACVAGSAAEEILIPGMLEVNMPQSGGRQKDRSQTAVKKAGASAKQTAEVPRWCEEDDAAGKESESATLPRTPEADLEKMQSPAPRHASASFLTDDLDTGEAQEIIPFPAAETMSLPEDERPMAPAAPTAGQPQNTARQSMPAEGTNAASASAKEAMSKAMPCVGSPPKPIARSSAPLGAWGEPVVQLDGESVSRAEFYRALVEAHGKEVLDRFLNRLLLKNELKRRGLEVTDAEIARVFQEHIRRFAGESGEDPSAILLRETGMAADEYKANVVWLEAAVRKLMKDRFSISEADVFNYYWMNRSQYTKPEMVRARHILVNPAQYAPAKDGMRAVGQSEWAKALEKALEIQNRLRSGLSFDDAARRFSHDSQTAARGGDLGFFPRHAMVKPFSDAAFGLKEGQISEPVKTIYGYHLIKVEERCAEQLIPFDQIQERVRRDYEDYLVMAQAADFLALLRQEAAEAGRMRILEASLSEHPSDER